MKHNKSEPVVENHHSLSYPIRTLSPAFSLVDRAREIEEASAFLESTTGGKLSLIAEQIRALRTQAEGILESARRDAELHRLECAFQKKIGQTIYLYERPTATRYFSLLSPEDWKGAPPHRFIGAFRLQADQCFEEVRV
ncbi:MAG: DUF2452 domain-containing protein [Spirochaetales bacterium]|nr:DUF2452 domain-containing protein [Spirochaetales bacterium]